MAYIGAGISRFNTADELTVTGDAQIDTTTLVVDSTNNRVGVGTASPATALDVTGTVTADAATLSGTSPVLSYSDTDNSVTAQIGSGTSDFNIATTSAHNLDIRTNNTRRMVVESDGDVSLYADDGSTQGFFWDASTQRLGVGNTAPARALHVDGGSSSIAARFAYTAGSVSYIQFENDTLSSGFVGYNNSGSLEFWTNGDERLRIDASGNVGIGRTPASTNNGLDASGAVLARGGVVSNQTSAGGLDFSSGEHLRIRSWGATAGTGIISFRTGGGGGSVDSEALRIDSSQNVLIANSSIVDVTSGTDDGATFKTTGRVDLSRSEGQPLNLRRRTSDGTILSFWKDTTNVGTIGVNGDRIYLTNAQEGIMIDQSANNLSPTSSTGTFNDNAMDLGESGNRWKDLYLSGGAYIGGTGSANYLDDYEEGTWTPTDQTGNGVTIGTLRAGYVKIGNMVHLHFYANTFSSSGVTAGAKISGLPFTNAANGWTCSLVQTGAGQISSQDLAVRVPAGEADVDFKGASLDTNVPWSHFNGTFMLWQITYQVD